MPKPYVEEMEELAESLFPELSETKKELLKTFVRARIVEVVEMMELEKTGYGYPLPEDMFMGTKAECAQDGYNAAVDAQLEKKKQVLG